MAKQTFTTGQVLTAAQMTSLQQTAMLGGAASAKTASYTLVAADAGTAITMSNASATTITVNTALFAAGDTVQITNIGAGVCTITAGTATVNTSASLALAQYESGTLTFTSTSASIFIKGAGAATGAAFAAFTPSFTGITLGNGTLTGRKLTTNGFETIIVKLTWGSTTSISGTVSFNTPSTMANGSNNQQFVMGYRDADTTNQYIGTIYFNNTTSFYTGIITTSGQYANTISATSPFTWTTNDTIYFLIQYEV